MVAPPTSHQPSDCQRGTSVSRNFSARNRGEWGYRPFDAATTSGCCGGFDGEEQEIAGVRVTRRRGRLKCQTRVRAARIETRHHRGGDEGSAIRSSTSRRRIRERDKMTKRRFSKGDHVSWNSEAGRVSGRIMRVVTSNVQFKGYTVHASDDEPQYEIKSDKTDHIAMHKGAALRRLAD